MNDAVPIVVGGTHYYIEALLWDNVLLHDTDDPLQSCATADADKHCASEFNEDASLDHDQRPGALLYERLTQVDPLMASWLHPHNERKIRRALEVPN